MMVEGTLGFDATRSLRWTMLIDSPPPSHDHVGAMVRTAGGCWCEVCGAAWELRATPPEDEFGVVGLVWVYVGRVVPDAEEPF